MIVYHGCSASAARSIAEHGFVRSSQRDDGYFGRGIYATPNAEYACLYAATTAHDVGAVVMCRSCVPSVYCVTSADYDCSIAGSHSKLRGQALKSEEAHFALVAQSTKYEACSREKAEYCELCVSQVAALCPVAILMVEAAEDTPTVPPTVIASMCTQLPKCNELPTDSQKYFSIDASTASEDDPAFLFRTQYRCRFAWSGKVVE